MVLYCKKEYNERRQYAKEKSYIQEQEQEMLALLAQNSRMTVSDICGTFQVSPATARRMLSNMEKKELLTCRWFMKSQRKWKKSARRHGRSITAIPKALYVWQSKSIPTAEASFPEKKEKDI